MNKRQLGVNIDHIATLRQARGTDYPSIVEAADIAQGAGADLITVHLREDRRHIQDHDVEALAERLTIRLNLEMAVSEEMIEIACKLKPSDVCLVPEKRQELTTEGGLDVVGSFDRVEQATDMLHRAGCRVSLFIDPQADQIEAAGEAGAKVIELHTGDYANAAGERQIESLERLRLGAFQAQALGMQVNSGHGLTLANVQPVAAIEGMCELNIGHSIVSRAVFVGLAEAIREMKQAIDAA